MLAVTVPSGPVVLVGHSMGGMTVLSHARQFPQRYRTRIVGAALISSAAEGCRALAGRGDPEEPRAGGGAVRGRATRPRPCTARAARPSR